MGRGKPKTNTEKGKILKTAIQIKREERKNKQVLLRQAPLPKITTQVLKEKKADKQDVPPMPRLKSQNLAFTKWTAYFQRALSAQETTLKVLDRVKNHMISEMNKLGDEEKAKYERGEGSNWLRLMVIIEESKMALARVKEAAAFIVPEENLGLDTAGLGMKGVKYGVPLDAPTSGLTSSEDEPDLMDTDEEAEARAEDSDVTPAEFIPPNAGKKASQPAKEGPAGKNEEATKENVEPNLYFTIDTNPTPVNMNGTSKSGKKRAKEGDPEEVKQAKKPRKEENAVVVPMPISEAKPVPTSTHKPSKVDFTAIEIQLKAEIEAGQKAKEERERAKLAKKEKKRKRMSEGDSEKEVKKSKREEEEKKKRKAEGNSDEEVLSDKGGKKRHKAAS